jgi:hypothetical protein
MKLANGIGKVPSSIPISSLPRNLSRPHHFSRSFLYLLQVTGLLFFSQPQYPNMVVKTMAPYFITFV